MDDLRVISLEIFVSPHEDILIFFEQFHESCSLGMSIVCSKIYSLRILFGFEIDNFVTQ